MMVAPGQDEMFPYPRQHVRISMDVHSLRRDSRGEHRGCSRLAWFLKRQVQRAEALYSRAALRACCCRQVTVGVLIEQQTA